MTLPFSRLIRTAGVALLLGLLWAPQASATHLDPSDAFYWQLPTPNRGPRYDQGAIATSADGNLVYVADTYGNEVEEYTSDGTFLHLVRYRQFTAPSGVTTDLSGNVYVVYETQGMVVKFSANLKYLGSWSVFGANSIAADRSDHIWVLTNFFNAVGEYDSNGHSVGGFVANLPGQIFPAGPMFTPSLYPPTGYDAPYKTVARAITIDRAGYPIVVGDSYQALSDPQPDCHVVIDEDHIDIQPYPDPLVSGEVARFRPDGTPVAYGWLSRSQMACWDIASDGNDPSGVAVDPNTGDVYSTSDVWLGVFPSRTDLSITPTNLNAPSYACYSLDCPARDWDLIAGNPPQGVAMDCRSNLYMLTDNGNARYVTKFINSDSVPPGACSPLLQRASLSAGVTVFPRFAVKGGGKASVLLGCSVKLCAGTVKLKVASGLCRGCVINTPSHFRIPAGRQKTLSLRLTKRGRRLLAEHPGFRVHVAAKLKGGKTSVESERLRAPVQLTARCMFPSSVDGSASVSGVLSASHGHELIRLEYVPASGAGVLLPAVQRTAFTNSVGRYADHYGLHSAGRWIVLVSWGGDSTQEPAGAAPCAGTVQKAQTQATITCPRSSSIGTSAPFSGSLSGAPTDANVAVLYEDPAGAIVIHNVTRSAGGFSDSFAPNQAGGWYAIAHYNGDSNHAPAVAACQFSVARPASTVSLQCSPDPTAHSISCTGQLTSGGTGIGGAQITLTYQPPPPGSATIHMATTMADGSFNDTMSVPLSGPPLAAGSWTVTAQYAGDSTHAPGSNAQTVAVP